MTIDKLRQNKLIYKRYKSNEILYEKKHDQNIQNMEIQQVDNVYLKFSNTSKRVASCLYLLIIECSEPKLER